MCGEKLPSEEAKVEAQPAGPRKCPDCAELSENAKVCEHCGHKFREPRPCPDCAEIMTTTVCDYCGYNIRAQARAAGQRAQNAVDKYDTGRAIARGLFGVAGAAIFDATSGGRPDAGKDYFARKKRR
jgi:hypothetical protein